MEGNYNDGEKEGLRTRYHWKNGQKHKEVNYKYGKEVNIKERGENGKEIKN